MRKTLYTALGMMVWRIGKRVVRRRARSARTLVTR